MNPRPGLDFASIPERIQTEVQRAIQRSIKGVEYIASAGPTPGETPKDVILSRGTMQLYHYRPMADEIYRIPLLIVMATTNRGYILDLAPGQSLVEFLLKRGFDVYMLDWTAPKPEEKTLRMEDYVLGFIPDCIKAVQRDSGENDVNIIGYCFGGVLSIMYASIFAGGPLKNLVCFTTPIDFREMKLFQSFADRRYFDVDRLVDSIGNVPPTVLFGLLTDPSSPISTQLAPEPSPPKLQPVKPDVFSIAACERPAMFELVPLLVPKFETPEDVTASIFQKELLTAPELFPTRPPICRP